MRYTIRPCSNLDVLGNTSFVLEDSNGNTFYGANHWECIDKWLCFCTVMEAWKADKAIQWFNPRASKWCTYMNGYSINRDRGPWKQDRQWRVFTR